MERNVRKRGERDGKKITFDASVRREQTEGWIIKCASLCGEKCAYECVYVCGGVGGELTSLFPAFPSSLIDNARSLPFTKCLL